MQRTKITQIIIECLDKIKEERYVGYDPADLLASNFSFIKVLPRSIRRFLTMINFYSPIDLRKILRIGKKENTTVMVLLGKIYLNMYKVVGDKQYIDDIDFIINWLLDRSIKINETIGWARIIDYQVGNKSHHDNYTSLTFINAIAASLFLDLYRLLNDEKYLNYLNKICNHILCYTNRIQNNEGICLSYTNSGNDEIINASILAGQVLSRTFWITGNEDYYDLSIKILKYTLAKQNEDGSWHYSYNFGRVKKNQIDFHQCYVLDGIKGYYFNKKNELSVRRDNAYIAGSHFYVEKMFDHQMKPYWRYPILYPTDIHNVSHGVYFLSKYSKCLQEYTDRLEKLISLLIDQFYDCNKKYFYYQIYGKFKIKHDFLRWNTAWSLLALTEYLLNVKC